MMKLDKMVKPKSLKSMKRKRQPAIAGFTVTEVEPIKKTLTPTSAAKKVKFSLDKDSLERKKLDVSCSSDGMTPQKSILKKGLKLLKTKSTNYFQRDEDQVEMEPKPKKKKMKMDKKSKEAEDTFDTFDDLPGTEIDMVVDDTKQEQEINTVASEVQKQDRKKIRKEYKEKKEQRKMKESNFYELGVKAKKIWEELRQHRCPKPRRQELLVELHNVIKGRVKEIIFTQDLSRVIQCLMMLGTPEIRSSIFQELKGSLVKLSQSKYSNFFVKKALTYGTKEQRRFIIKAFNGHIPKLLRHSIASEAVECAYNEWAVAAERNSYVEEFYGPLYVAFKSDDVHCLKDFFSKHPEYKDKVLAHMKEQLQFIISKPAVLKCSMVHRLLLEFLTNCSPSEKADIIKDLKEVLVHILHTPDGTNVALKCVFSSDAKARKGILKGMKGLVLKICHEERGHMVLLALLDNVDDTVILKQVIIKEVLQNIVEVMKDVHGRKVLFHMLSPRNKKFLLPQVIEKLAEGDGNPFSHKDPETRHNEILAAVSQPLLQLVCAHSEELLTNPSYTVLGKTILLECLGDKTDAFEAVADCAAQPFFSGNVEKYHIIEDAAGSRVLRDLLRADKENYSKDENVTTFAQIFLNKLDDQTIRSWLDSNRGAYLCIHLLETEIPSVAERVKTALQKEQKKLLSKSYAAAYLLLGKLK